MIPYGDVHPSLADDRIPIVLLILDGLGDRTAAALGHQTPAEAAHTPNLDALAARGASGIHLPFGPGRAPSSEISHWAMFGYRDHEWPGRAVLEARGFGVDVPQGIVCSYAALRPVQTIDETAWVVGRAAPSDAEDAEALFGAVTGATIDGIRFDLRRLTRGEALLTLTGDASPDISDTDPLFEQIHPWMRPVPRAGASDPQAARHTATALERFLLQSRAELQAHPVNRRRAAQGLPALDVITTKWTGRAVAVPGFCRRVGIAGAAVTSSSLYRGLAATLSMKSVDIASLDAPGADLTQRLEAAGKLLEDTPFVHVHTKATDEAGHTKDPEHKMAVIEQLDEACGLLGREPFKSAVVAVTGDHATPSVDGVMHSGDPTPLVVTAPTVRPDAVDRFGEQYAARGSLGSVSAADLLPIMLGYANRPMFLGTKIGSHRTPALPDDPEPMPAGPA